MRIIFICRANVARSKIAEALFNKYCKNKGKAFSAGIKVSEGLKKMKLGEIDEAKNVIKCMEEEGINLRNKKPKQIFPEQLDNFDKSIIMAEPETIPDFLLNNKQIIWEVKDPKGKDIKEHRRIKEEIKRKIKGLMKEI